MQHILIPQAARAMLPVIVSQLVVLVKDTALGYIIGYTELLQSGVATTCRRTSATWSPAAIVVGDHLHPGELALTATAGWLERRTRSGGKAPRKAGVAAPVRPPVEELGVGARRPRAAWAAVGGVVVSGPAR